MTVLAVSVNESHAGLLAAADKHVGDAGMAWASHVAAHAGKYYFYTTLRQRTSNEHCIGVAVGDSPTGPFKDARGTPLITDGMTTNSSRPNADIDLLILRELDLPKSAVETAHGRAVFQSSGTPPH